MVPPWLWTLTGVLMPTGVLLLLWGPAWLGLVLFVLPALGLLPLALEDRRRRR